MGRLFQAQIDIAAAVTQVDIVELEASASRPIKVHEVFLTTDIEQDTNEAQDELRIVRYVGAFTSGSGGVTVNALDLAGGGLTEDDTTVMTGNTTQISGGTGQILGHVWVNNRIGWHYLPTPETRPVVGVTDAFVVQMQSAFVAATAIGGWVVFEELTSS